jgi:hypothetical protein
MFRFEANSSILVRPPCNEGLFSFVSKINKILVSLV